MDVSIIIPNYNSAKTLVNNFPDLAMACEYFSLNTGYIAEIIIVDDNSTDNSLALINELKNKYKKLNIRLITSSKNSGFSSSVNKGVSHAKYEIVVLLNTDVKPEKNFLHKLIRHFSDEDIFAVGCMDKSIEKDNVILRGRGLGEWRRGFLAHKRGSVDKSNTLWVSGGSSAFNKAKWMHLGGMYEIYNPFYWEDIDISYRALKAGYKLYFENKSIVTHLHDIGAIKSSYSTQQIKTVSYKNQIIFAWINISDLDLLCKHLFWLPANIFSAILRFDLPFIKGFIRAVLNLKYVMKLRSQAQKIKTKTDREVINIFSK